MPSLKLKNWINSRSSPSVLLNPRNGLILCGIFGAGFILAVILHYFMGEADQQIEAWIFSGTTRISYSIFDKITMLGETILLLPICMGLMVWWASRKEWNKTAGILLTVICGGLLALFLKLLFHSPRPDINTGWIKEIDFGFPSGHAVMSLLFWGFLAYLFIRGDSNPKRRFLIGLSAGLITFTVGLTRLFLGVHYPLDVLGGWTWGAMWLTFSILVMDFTGWRRGLPR